MAPRIRPPKLSPEVEADLRESFAEYKRGETVTLSQEELDHWAETGELPERVEQWVERGETSSRDGS